MIDPLTCPEPAHLAGLLDGTEPPGDLLEHLARCPRCQNALEGLAVGGVAWLRAPPAVPPLGPRPHLRQLLESYKGLATAADLLAAPASEPSLDFLLPTAHPGALGAVGPYPVLEVIGSGGMGVVFRALDLALNRAVAVKALAPQWVANGAARQWFLREARAAAAVAHEHVVSVHAVDESNGRPYLVMEYVPGPSLQERIDRDGPLAPECAARVALQVAEGLAAAHALGLVHRDVKPANILLDEGAAGRARLTDFGLARAVDGTGAPLHGAAAGTPDYIAPEQASGGGTDHRADLYALGCVIYAACTGEPPFRAATALGVLRLTATVAPRPIRELNPGTPPDLEAIALRLLAKDPADRFPTAAAVATELRAVLDRLRPQVPRRKRVRHVRAAAGAAVLLALGAAALALYMRTARPAVDGSVPGAGTAGGAPPPDAAAPVMSFEGHAGSVRGLVAHPDGTRFASVTGWPKGDGSLRFWTTAASKSTHRAYTGPAQINHVALIPDGSAIVAGCSDGAVRLYDWASGAEMVYLSGDRSELQCVAVAPGGRRIAAGDSSGRIRVWDPATGRRVLTISAHDTYPCRGVAFSPDGKTIASVGLDGILHTWDITAGLRLITAPAGHAMQGVAFAADGRKIVTAGHTTATVWDAVTGRRLIDLHDADAAPLTAIAAAPAGAAAATGGSDGTVRVWNVDTGALLVRTPGGSGPAWAVTFTADGRCVLSGSGGAQEGGAGDRSEIRMWAVPAARP